MRLAREERALAGCNLGTGAQNIRLRSSILTLAAAIGVAVFMIHSDVPRVWRLALFIPFMLSTFGAVQGLYRTCPGHANRHTRVNEANEVEVVAGEEEIRRTRRLATHVMGATFLSALAATLVVFLMP
jgi:hypothetical protein